METQTLTWTKSPGNEAVARYCHSASYDSANDRLLIFGGLNKSGERLNDLWAYEFAAAQWVRLDDKDAGNAPAARFGHRSAYVEKDNELLVFGGILGENALYSFNLTTNTWSTVQTKGTSPVPRM